MKDEKKVVEFENEAMENAQAVDDIIVEVEKQNKIVAFWKKCKTWQKVAIIGGAAVGLGVGGIAIYKLVSGNGEVVTDAVEAVAENAAELGMAVTEF